MSKPKKYRMATPAMIATLTELAVLAAVIAWPVPGQAGIINIQSILATEAEEGLSGSVTGSLDWRAGNSERLTTSLATMARYKTGKHLIIGLARGDLFRNGDGTVERNTFEHARYRYSIDTRLLGELFVQHEFSEVRRLDLRALVGIGPKVDILRDERFYVSLGVAYMLEYEHLQDQWKVDADADDTEDTVLNHRLSSYVTASYELDEDRMAVTQTLYVQPRITDPADVRLLGESQLTVNLTRRLSLTTSFVLALDSKPPVQDSTVPAAEREPDVEPYDTTLKSAITYSF